MKKIIYAVMPLVLCFLDVPGARAEISVDQLLEQSAIVEGDVAVRDMPGWSTARKIVVRDIGRNIDDIISGSDRVEFVLVESREAALEQIQDADALLGFCDAELIAAAKRLVWVQIFAAGAERCVSVGAIANGDVVLTNMQKMSSPVIAEHAIAMMWSLSRKLPQFGRIMETGKWQRNEAATAGMAPIAGRTLLVAGLGGIGTEVARLAAALGMRVTATRNSSRQGPDFVDYVGMSNELHDLAAEADVVVNALPITTATAGIFNREFFAALKPGALFVNVGRGKTVVTADLVAALDSGALAGAGLDVTDPEPLPADHPLWGYPNVIVTPHVAGRGGELERHGVLLKENLRRYIAGERLLNVVDPVKGY